MRLRFLGLQVRFLGMRVRFLGLQVRFLGMQGRFRELRGAPKRIPGKMVSLQTPFVPMPALFSRFWFSLRLALLAVPVLLVLGLNQRAVRVLRPLGKGEARFSRATVVKQKVLFEATASGKQFVAPLLAAWLPLGGPGGWRPTLRRMLAVPHLRAGIGAGQVFRARLLAVALSPQAP